MKNKQTATTAYRCPSMRLMSWASNVQFHLPCLLLENDCFFMMTGSTGMAANCLAAAEACRQQCSSPRDTDEGGHTLKLAELPNLLAVACLQEPIRPGAGHLHNNDMVLRRKPGARHVQWQQAPAAYSLEW